MEEELDFIIESAKEAMEHSITHLNAELLKIRAGKASATMVDSVSVDYYGTNTPLNQVSNINTPDPRTISIQPWEKSMLEIIERAIINSNLGLNPQNNGEMIIISVPSLTEERRQQLVRQSKSEVEKAKISIRNARRDANDEVKKLLKKHLEEDLAHDIEAEIQKITDTYSHRVEEIFHKKEEDIMTV